MTEIWEWPATEIARAVAARTVSATEVVEAHLARQAVVNPVVNALVQDCAGEARAEAAALDARIAGGAQPGPLAGVPVTIKVNVDQKGHATTNGLRLLESAVATEDNPVVANLRRAGAIVVGRSNAPAFSMRWFTNNSLHGQTLNPRNMALTPGGSSGGAAASVAAGMAPLAHGTDIAGSVRYPAYACGLHGLRPTLGRVPAWNPSVPDRFIGGQLMAVSGPLARTIPDLGLALAAMSAPDVRDPWLAPAPLQGPPHEKRAALTLAPDGMPVAAEIREALKSAAARLEDAGWTVEEVDCPPVREAAAVNATLWMAEVMQGAGEMVARENDPDANFVFRMMCEDTGPITLDAVMRAFQTRARLVREWEEFHQRYPLLLCPVSGALPFEQQLDVRSEADFAFVYEAQLTQRALAVMGMPCLAVATGMAEGSPVGVQLVAGRFREDILLAAGAELERSGYQPDVAMRDA